MAEARGFPWKLSMMTLPPGWVTGVDISRTAQIKALGNGVVPLQAAVAFFDLRARP
jgi:DNA (cytosine-5)-methyltransferase 1